MPKVDIIISYNDPGFATALYQINATVKREGISFLKCSFWEKDFDIPTNAWLLKACVRQMIE